MKLIKGKLINIIIIILLIIFILFFSIIIFPFNVTERTYYVAMNGNDSNPGTKERPWLTITKAANTLVAGDTVYIREGEYYEHVIVQNSGTEGNPITFTSYAGETAVVNGLGVDINEAQWDGLIMLRGKSYITIRNLTIKNSEWFGIFINQCNVCDGDLGIYGNATNVTIENNYIYNTTASGIAVQWGHDIVIEGNEIVLACNKEPPGAVQEIITMAYMNNGFEINNNIIHDGGNPEYGGEGIDAKFGASNGKIFNNIIYNVSSVGIYVDGWSKWAKNIEVYGNIVNNVEGSCYGVSAEVSNGVADNISIYNNIGYNCGISGVIIPAYGDGAVSNVTVINNVFYNNSQGGAWLGYWGAPLNNIILRNNIFSANNLWQIRNDKPTSAIIIENNLIDGYTGWQNETKGNNYIEGVVQFVNPYGADFHLKSTSPAIDKGSFVNAPSIDFDGKSRPSGAGYDIGAFEFSPD